MKPISGVKKLIAVASGKGGVGKSTVSGKFSTMNSDLIIISEFGAFIGKRKTESRIT